MNIPRSTYRVQLTPQFGFSNAASILPYLASLGVSTLYCSPVLQARRDSTHGYDTTDPTHLSEQLGGEAAWGELCRQARFLGMTILLDIVPNHMATSLENLWWRDLLAHGRFSPYASYFDIDWTPPTPGLKNRVLLPVLDRPLKDAVAAGVLKLAFDTSELTMALGDLRLPLDVRSQGQLLRRIANHVAGQNQADALSLAAGAEALRPIVAAPTDDRQMEYERRLGMGRNVSRFLSRPGVRSAVLTMLADTTARQLRQYLREQAYEVAWWKQAARRLNYRRFFDINDLVGMRVEDRGVFEATHSTLRRLASDSVVCGFRIDHIDGLRDPREYLERLRLLSPDGARFTVVEKILTGDETLPTDWPVEGTTGYEFLSMVNGLFVDPHGLSRISQLYCRLLGSHTPRTARVRGNKRRVIKALFKGEFNRLHEMLLAAVGESKSREVSPARVRRALIDVTARLPVYRTYLRPGNGVTNDDMLRIHAATTGAPPMEKTLLRDIIVSVGTSAPDSTGGLAASEFVARWQQTTGAVMAKGFEDTTLYQDATLLSLNEVGSPPDIRPVSVEQFHEWNSKRLREWPHTLNCTATHDTKRGEDIRARLNVLTTLNSEWASIAEQWTELVKSTNPDVDASMALLLLQTLLGTWSSTREHDDSFRSRMKEYLTKAAREAKTHSSWLQPNPMYEQSCHSLVDLALDHARVCPQMADLGVTVEFYGSLFSLSQVLLKATCPGLPDFYQGSELWDLSLVDPDNRRPVDFERRRLLLSTLLDSAGEDSQATVQSLVTEWPSERAKLFLTQRVLEARAGLSELFETGDYIPLEVRPHPVHVCAFARTLEARAVVVAVPIRVAPTRPFRLPMGNEGWGRTTLELPAELARLPYRNVLTGKRIEASPVGRLSMAVLTEDFPVVLLTNA